MTKSIRGIIKFKEKIVLVKRIVADNLYYVLPGGHMKKDETEKQTCKREVKEETSLNVIPIKKVYVLKETEDHQSIYYKCRLKNKESFINIPRLKMSGDENKRMTKENFYESIWLDLEKLNEVKLYREVIRNLLRRLDS